MNLVTVLDLLAAVVVLTFGWATVNTITWRTWRMKPWFCGATIVLTVGAMAVLLGPLVGVRNPDWPEVLLHVGLAVFAITTQRRPYDGHRAGRRA